MYFKRLKDGLYWTGAVWSKSKTSLATKIAGSNWNNSVALPSASATDAAKQLSEGPYNVTAIATDKSGKSTTATSNFSFDHTIPSVAIASPVNGSFVNSLTSSVNGVSGTASDNLGLARVDFVLKRGSDGFYWTGESWDKSKVALATLLEGNKWRYTVGLPLANFAGPNNLADGAYSITATATDKGGNSQSATVSFVVDATPPFPDIDSPANNSILKSLSTVSGTAKDNLGGSGVRELQAYIERESDGLYWTGKGWGDETPLSVSLQGDAWTVSAPLPSPVNGTLDDGHYFIGVNAIDKVGNSLLAYSTFTVDNTRPSVADVVTPSSNATVTSLPVISVKATDNGTGSIAKVSVYLLRSDGVFWNGTSWGDTKDAALPTALKDGLWSTTGALPIPNTSNPKIKLTPGDYTIFAYAYDQAGNATDDKSAFHVPASAQAAAQVSTPATASPTVTPPPSAPSPSAPNSYVGITKRVFVYLGPV